MMSNLPFDAQTCCSGTAVADSCASEFMQTSGADEPGPFAADPMKSINESLALLGQAFNAAGVPKLFELPNAFEPSRLVESQQRVLAMLLNSMAPNHQQP